MGGTAPAILIPILLTFLFRPCQAMETLVIEGLGETSNPTVHVQDSVVFKHLQNLYLFHSRRSFDLCIFAEATLVYNGSSKSTEFTWRAPRPGHYYFSARDDLRRSCEKGEKVPVRVIVPGVAAPAPQPTAGGDLPAFPSPGSVSSSTPSLAPDSAPLQPRDGPPLSPRGDGIPFIGSNPAVPLPTGETDTATIRPLPTPGAESQVVVGSGPGSSSRIQMVAVLASVMMYCALGL